MKTRTITIARIAFQWLANIEDTVAILLLCFMVALVVLAIAARMTINFESSAWEEIARFAFIWLIGKLPRQRFIAKPWTMR